MPGGDGTGPMGAGPMTGRAAGYCAGYPVPGFMNLRGGRGFGFWGRGGRGGGRGRRNWFYATGLTGWQRGAMGWPSFAAVPAGVAPVTAAAPGREQEIDMLKRQQEYFSNALDEIGKRVEELQSQA
ncbi:MAG TPA: DUF5320 domain-containing protein [Phycisphaerae bacterium]|nr:DUF5320 domain-containing protein [Phycisphaerae bacterium]HUT57355.1 DUF5320 domain-containing protein [Phycisphaerae bacterium]